MTSLLAAPAWWDLATPAGRFTLCPVKPDRDLPHLHRWMNDPAVARHWRLDGPAERAADQISEQRVLPYAEPYLARLSGRPLGYWELYRAADAPLADRYPARPDDLGIRLLIGEPAARGLGLGRLLLTALCDAVQRGRETARRAVAELDADDIAAARAFAAAGFVPHPAVPRPGRRTALIVRDPASRPEHGGARP
jgi:acetyl CoA:N6-hydroxylysine acetyl transferase